MGTTELGPATIGCHCESILYTNETPADHESFQHSRTLQMRARRRQHRERCAIGAEIAQHRAVHLAQSSAAVLFIEGMGDLMTSSDSPVLARIVVVDDELEVRQSLRAHLERSGFESWDAADAGEAATNCPRDVDLVLVGFHAHPGNVPADLARIRETSPGASLILMTDTVNETPGFIGGSETMAWLNRPFTPQQMLAAVRRALEVRDQRASERPSLSSELEASGFARIIGESERMLRVKSLLERVAASPTTTVLLTGESGTGKDLASRLIHSCGVRAGREFVNITCSALPDTLLESELFGHERGAFTDAKIQKRGLFEIADKGTIFLDEIGELSPTLQAKLLRFLEERTFRRVGGSTDIRVDVRVIAATNRDLRREVQAGRFREDLYYRLSVFPIELPALRKRATDIPALVRHVLLLLNRELGRSVRGLTPGAEALLMAYEWPGNVRELRNALERAMLMTDADQLDEQDFQSLRGVPMKGAEAAIELPEGGVVLEDLERSLLLQALDRTDWNKTRAAKLLGLNRDQIRYRITKFGLAHRPKTYS